MPDESLATALRVALREGRAKEARAAAAALLVGAGTLDAGEANGSSGAGETVEHVIAVCVREALDLSGLEVVGAGWGRALQAAGAAIDLHRRYGAVVGAPAAVGVAGLLAQTRATRARPLGGALPEDPGLPFLLDAVARGHLAEAEGAWLAASPARRDRAWRVLGTGSFADWGLAPVRAAWLGVLAAHCPALAGAVRHAGLRALVGGRGARTEVPPSDEPGPGAPGDVRSKAWDAARSALWLLAIAPSLRSVQGVLVAQAVLALTGDAPTATEAQAVRDFVAAGWGEARRDGHDPDHDLARDHDQARDLDRDRDLARDLAERDPRPAFAANLLLPAAIGWLTGAGPPDLAPLARAALSAAAPRFTASRPALLALASARCAPAPPDSPR